MTEKVLHNFRIFSFGKVTALKTELLIAPPDFQTFLRPLYFSEYLRAFPPSALFGQNTSIFVTFSLFHFFSGTSFLSQIPYKFPLNSNNFVCGLLTEQFRYFCHFMTLFSFIGRLRLIF